MSEGSGTMEFTPSTVDVKKGEQIKFVIKNTGTFNHEFMLDSIEHDAKHKIAMKKNSERQDQFHRRQGQRPNHGYEGRDSSNREPTPVTVDGLRHEWTRVEQQCPSTLSVDVSAQGRAVGQKIAGGYWLRQGRVYARLLAVVLSFTDVSAFAADTLQMDPRPPAEIRALPPGTPRTVAEHNNRAIELAKKGQLDDAIAELSLALELAPEDTIALYNRANFYFRSRDLDRAIADFTAVIRLKPNFALAFMNRGTAYSIQGRLDEALADLNAAEELRVDNYLIFYNRAAVHGRRREFDLAIADFDTTLRLKPKYVPALIGRGLAFETIGRTDLAINDYRSALQADPNNKLAEDALQRTTGKNAGSSGPRNRKK